MRPFVEILRPLVGLLQSVAPVRTDAGCPVVEPAASSVERRMRRGTTTERMAPTAVAERVSDDDDDARTNCSQATAVRRRGQVRGVTGVTSASAASRFLDFLDLSVLN